MVNKPTSLYIHIPFCSHICKYCDFTKLFYFEKYEKPYLDSLEKEIKSYKINKVKTLYIGGGTPTSLSDEGFERILKIASQYLALDYEFSCEANVENLTESKLKLMKKYGVNRLSIGVESTSNEMLTNIGRHHTWEDAKNVVKLAKNNGFNNINIDLIYGFKGQSLKDLENDLVNFLTLDINHISIYSLIVEPGSIFFNLGEKEQDHDENANFYNFIVDFLRENGFERYEISNFAKNKQYSKHNLTYWHDEEYYGCGLGASGFVNKVRYTNTKNLTEYIKGKFIGVTEDKTLKSDIEDFLLTNLRLESGFKKSVFFDKFSVSFENLFSKTKLMKYINNEDLIISDTIKLTDKGLLIMDYILSDLFLDLDLL